ncbi:protocadherin gamma-B5-like [Motacilla alba alba]|uniref:protocadherin gamma-B5-like n=1 Tax=Motacilla alba alba TaxID=1094192 RepID=UPI0018D4E46E|nr:protocadherin gamma-B5-like [Motacilla alba alba]
MAGRRRQRRGPGGGRALLAAVLLCVCCRAAAERVRYAIAEELGRGSLVGPLARDLGLSADELPARKLQVASAGKKQLKYFTVDEENGNLYVNERLDREEMCGDSATCSVSFEALVHNPLNIFRVEVDIRDVNDNTPRFLREKFQLEINEFTSPGARFYLGMAEDPDVGSNSLQGYELEANGYFTVEVKEGQDGSKSAELVLRHSLDRESEPSLRLTLTALDGGDPPRSGTAQLWINVTDANDNPPVFAQDRYRVSLREDAPPGSIVLNVSASDADAGTNARITYGFGEMPAKVLQKFRVDALRGTISLQEELDFEDTRAFSLAVEATDGGGLVAHCKVEVEVLDVNDNAPEITILSLSSPVPEDAPVGTVVALLNVNDLDSGENGQVSCELSGEAALSLVASSGGSYKVVTASALDREQACEHRVTVVARDRGRPALRSSRELVLEVSDVNDNAPVFEEAAYSAYVAENNAAGALVLRVQARDADAGANGRVSYWLAGGSAGAAGAAPLVSVEARSGALYAQRSLDYERCREFAVAVRAQDGGSPARSSTATVRVFVLDRNDNAPRVLWPAAAAAAAGEAAGGAAAPFEVVPRSAEAGYLVAKVVAVDADAGRNAWLSYELVAASEPALFRVGLHSGEVRTARAVSERDAAKQRVVAVVKDHGQPALSATATLHVVLAESLQEALPELSERPAGAEAAAAAAAELQFYLVLALALLSALLVLSVALAVLARLRRAGPPAVLRCLGAQRFSLAGAAFPADFCEGTLPYSYNLCVAPPARAPPEAAWPPPPVPILSAEELLAGDACDKPSLSSSAVVGEVPPDRDVPQLGDQVEFSRRKAVCVRLLSHPSELPESKRRTSSARCLQRREEAAGAAVDREEREGARSAAAPPAAGRIEPFLPAWQDQRRAVCDRSRSEKPC